MNNSKMRLKISKDDQDVAYLYLPDHPGEGTKGIIKKQIRLSDVVDNLKGPDIYVDIDSNNVVIGIEILI